MASSAERVARNESLFRNVNEAIAGQLLRRSGLSEGPWLFICECSDLECTQQVELTITQYRTAREAANRFAVVPGHVDTRYERVLEQGERYSIVEKVGEAGEAAAVRLGD